MIDISKGFLDYGVLGVLVLILLYAIKILASKADERITEDRKIFEKINENLKQQNELYNLLIEEFKHTKTFFETTINYERETSKYCFETLHKTQLEKKEKLIKIEESLSSFHKRLTRLENGK